MGGLIQTKGTQRLAKWFNDVFDNSATGILLARRVQNNVGGGDTLPQSFKKAANSLLEISDAFIAQNAIPPTTGTTPTWPAGGNDVLYPSATMMVDTVVSSTVLRFALPTGITTIPTFIVKDAAVSCIKGGRRKIDRGTTVTTTPTVSGGKFDVTLSKPMPVNAAKGDLISFAKGKHQMLVRRWRWYLKNDLRSENDAAIKQAISSALEDTDFKKITFQAIEDTQKVIIRTETLLDDTDLEFADAYNLHIVLVTQQTTAPDPLDPQ